MTLNINAMMPYSGRMVREDGSTVNLADLFTGLSGEVKPASYVYVGKNGNDSTGDGSANFPYLTISAAITAATSGTTVFVWPGTYTESLTLKAGVFITTPTKFAVTIVGNITANFTGTVVIENIVVQNASSAGSGTVLAFSGTGAQNLQMLGSDVNSVSTSGAGDAINWTNTNASSKIQFIDGNVNVLHSGATARAFYSTTGAVGSLIANRVTFKIDNYDNVCLSVGGAISFTHTSDAVYGQTVMSGSASMTAAQLTHTCNTVPVLNTTSSGTTSFLECIDLTTASPAAIGTGVLIFLATAFVSTGSGGASTLSGGLGPIPLKMSPVCIRPGLLGATGIASGQLSGTLMTDGTNLYFVAGTTRYVITMTPG
jgi:hypothetical protein